MANFKKPKCKQCKFLEYTKTLGSPVVPVWHCRSGFTPWEDAFGGCIKRAERNFKAYLKDKKEHPESYSGYSKQLEIDFK